MLRKFILFLLSVIFSLVFSVFFAVFNLKYFFLEADFYKQIFIKSNLYVVLIEEFPSLIFQEDPINEEGLNLPFGINEEDLKDLLANVLGAEYFQSQTELLLDNIFSFLTEKDTELNLSFSTEDVKDQLQEETILLIEQKINELPVCTDSELLDLVETMENSLALPSCLPVGANSGEIDQILEDQDFVTNIFSQMPSTFSLSEESFGDGVLELRQVKNVILILINQVYWISLLVSLFVLGLIFSIANPLSSRLKWIGSNLFNFAVLPFIISIVGLLTSEQIGSTLLHSFGSDITQQMITSLSNVITILLKEIWLLLLKETGVVLVISIVLFLLSKIVKRKERKKREEDLIEEVQKLETEPVTEKQQIVTKEK